ncbi:hypothetical protein BU26DRAFT_251620 [Trematosphaeria pertusa]|uniref:F-box domain-containing protein n=1 Tax=Trematosphaeria pertusa TaxID=390896 RepID=A0A6A6IRH3_9PLEO|nr:uncharacterized protein BU26DRAFT_251620 [Trematosphaeria pertusa]KAF2252123.1 hypothetical protein BU26DRAFT_251620 [Trematosphaeria pertusa]
MNATKIISYEQLPYELQEHIVEVLSASALQSWSLVNKHAYILTLRRRYRSVRFQTPSAAYAFSHHRLHTSLGSPRHVRNAFVNLPSSLSRCDLEKYALAIQPIPAAALRTFSVHIGNGATYSSWALPLLLGAESHIRALRVKSRNESWFGVFDCTTFTQLRSLELRTTNQVFSAPQYSTLLRVALQCTAKTLTSLDIGHATTSTAAELHTSPGLNPLRGFISQSSLDRAAAPHHPHLECLAFRDLDFGSAEAFDWSIFGAHGPETLRLLQCYNLAPMLETTMRNLLPTWRDLTALDFVLPNMRMQTHPASLAALEDALCCCAAANLGLKHLRVEIPAAGRTPDARAIALHGNLESLVVGVTDADGRWLPFEADELQTVIEGCMRLQLVGLILPPVGTDSEYYLTSLRRLPRLSHVLIAGAAEASRPVYSPAWLHCGPQGTLDAGDLALSACRSLGRGPWSSGNITLGVHAGPYYCATWTGELAFFVADGDDDNGAAARRVSFGGAALTGPLSRVLLC